MDTHDPTMTWALTGAGESLRSLAPSRPPVDRPYRVLVPERYEDLGFLAAGGMGELRRVRDRVLGVELALKTLAPRHAGDADTRDLFLAEARATAQLQHPGIVAVQEFGELDDGRPWFTMTIVQGQTLAKLVADGESPLRRRISVLRQVADVLAYAHAAGAVHRDVKPENIMIGAFGEVRLMDWGLATLPGVDHPLGRPGVVVGTPMYMAPEQAAGRSCTAATDVWALGGILFRLLAGRAPRTGPAMVVLLANRDRPAPRLSEDDDVPSSLRALCHQCLSRDPVERPDAAAVSAALEAWLDGLQRRQDALTLVEAARRELPEIEALLAEADALGARASAHLDSLPPDYDVADKEPAWELQDRADALRSDAALRGVTWHQKLRAALSRSPDLPEAHALLADHYRDALERAEHERDSLGIARNEILLRTHDRGRHAAFLRGDGALTLHTSVPARARLFRFVERRRRLEPVFERDLGRTPLVQVELARGSWLVTLDREDLPDAPTVHYPVFIERASHWDGVAPEGGDPHPIRLPGPGELAPDDCYVPAGWCIVGGDAEAVDPLPRQRVWVDAFVMKRFPVTFGEYAAWLQELGDAGDEEAWPWRQDVAPGVERRGGRVALAVPSTLPVTCIPHAAAARYARDLGWRLPHGLWCEKAARGVDGRLTPWGDTLERSWSRVLGSAPLPSSVVPVDSFSTDRSVYGVRGVAGNVFTWCSNPWLREGSVHDGRPADTGVVGGHMTLRGGCYTAGTNAQRVANRFGQPPGRRGTNVGFRLARSSSE